MEKHFITALLVLILLAPQSGLEANSRYNEVKERDHDAEERDHEDKKRYHKSKNRYHKSKKRHHKSKKHHHSSRKFFRFARATKAELELLKQSIAEISAKMDALEPQSQLPTDLAVQLVSLQTAIDGNSSDVTMALDDIIEIMMDIDSIIARISALEPGPEPPDGEKLVFSGHFIGKKTPDSLLVQDWLEFRSKATGPFTSIEIRGSAGGGVSCSDPVTATEIANALNSGQTATFNCENRMWNVGPGNPRTGGGGIELNAGSVLLDSVPPTGNCLEEASVRPLMGNSNWGGIGFTCVAPSQTLEVILTLKNTVL